MLGGAATAFAARGAFNFLVRDRSHVRIMVTNSSSRCRDPR
jgi:hypothetical protein